MINITSMRFQDHDVQMIRDPQGQCWWPAHILCDVLGIANVTAALSRLDQDEKRLITIDTVFRGPQKIWCINESGLYHLTLTSRKPQAKAFKRWVTHEVLPQLRRTGQYKITAERFLANTERPTQVQNSRDVGAVQSAFGGRGGCIRWYRNSLHQITGAYPKEWRERGRLAALPYHVRRRGREVTRRLAPAGACATSLADELVVRGVEESEAIAIGCDSTMLFQRILDAGVTPAELHSSPLDGLADDLRRGGTLRESAGEPVSLQEEPAHG